MPLPRSMRDGIRRRQWDFCKRVNGKASKRVSARGARKNCTCEKWHQKRRAGCRGDNGTLQMDGARYTFGDNEQASLRLRRLAEIYEQETRELLQRGGIHAPRLAVDLGCGPGWSTQLIRDVLNPDKNGRPRCVRPIYCGGPQAASGLGIRSPRYRARSVSGADP